MIRRQCIIRNGAEVTVCPIKLRAKERQRELFEAVVLMKFMAPYESPI